MKKIITLLMTLAMVMSLSVTAFASDLGGSKDVTAKYEQNESEQPRERTQAGNGHDCFQSRSPWTAPLKEGATIHRSSRCVASCRKPLAGSR